MQTKITRINEISKSRPNEIFTSIYHLINYDLLYECYSELDGAKATGLDKVTKEEYGINLKAKLEDIEVRLRNLAYRPSPARKVNIPKANGKLRGLAIANFEDKIVQMAFKKIIEAIFEPKFSNNMFGFRPDRGCHDCLKYLNKCIEKCPTNYILDADLKGYFDNIGHKLIIDGLETHIRDKRFIRIIIRFLKAGIMEDGKHITSDKGTPQGAILSPVLANIVMYYGIILFVEKIKQKAKGYVEIVNYADDMVLCFQYREEAEKTYQLLKLRLKQLGLEFAEDKTRLIEFGRFANKRSKENEISKAATFDFLGFTHYCSTAKDGNRFRVKRKTSKKKLKQKIQEFGKWIKENRSTPIEQIMDTVERKLIGHYNYYGITDNSIGISKYYYAVKEKLYKWLNRRSQKKSFNSNGFNRMILKYCVPTPRINVNIYDM